MLRLGFQYFSARCVSFSSYLSLEDKASGQNATFFFSFFLSVADLNFEQRAAYRFSRAFGPRETARKGRREEKLRRSYTHPRAGASRHLAKSAPDWSVVRSRAFRRSSSSSLPHLSPPPAVSSPRRVPRRPLVSARSPSLLLLRLPLTRARIAPALDPTVSNSLLLARCDP